jgi:pSer/pThr/pTyr-binding forkhead associated (FHA) protein
MPQEHMIDLAEFSKADWTIMLHDRVITHFTLNEGTTVTIGRSPEADVVIDNTAVSRLHSRLELRDGIHYLTDLNSKNGTSVNGKIINTKVSIGDDDSILIGKFKLCRSTETVQKASSSYATSMDIDDETVFVSSPQPAAADVRQSPLTGKEAYRLTVIEGNASPKNLSLDGKSSVKIGKDSSCDLIIPGFFVAKAQCYVVSKNEKYFIVPQRSWASTKLNDVIIRQERLLRRGDIIEIRQVKIKFS